MLLLGCCCPVLSAQAHRYKYLKIIENLLQMRASIHKNVLYKLTFTSHSIRFAMPWPVWALVWFLYHMPMFIEYNIMLLLDSAIHIKICYILSINKIIIINILMTVRMCVHVYDVDEFIFTTFVL